MKHQDTSRSTARGRKKQPQSSDRRYACQDMLGDGEHCWLGVRFERGESASLAFDRAYYVDIAARSTALDKKDRQTGQKIRRGEMFPQRFYRFEFELENFKGALSLFQAKCNYNAPFNAPGNIWLEWLFENWSFKGNQ